MLQHFSCDSVRSRGFPCPHFFKASFISFMLKGSVMEQSSSSPYDDRMMFSVSSPTCLKRSRVTWVVLYSW